MAYTRQQFIAKIAPLAMADMRKTGILASLTIAQACLESANGNSGLTLKANNLFGIKGAYNGQKEVMPTTEYYNGKKCTVQAAFRKYPTWQESINDHSDLFLRLDRYKNLRGCKDYKLACKYVRDDGYATDPHYTAMLLKIIEDNKLYEYDTVKEDKQLKDAVHKIAGEFDINEPAWNDVANMKMQYVPGLIKKLGGIVEINSKITKCGMNFELERWKYIMSTGAYSANNVRALLIKYAATL